MSSGTVVVGGVRVMSVLPGRVRLRAVSAEGRRRLADVAEKLRASSEVTSVDVRERSASVVVRFDPAHVSAMGDRLLDLGVDVRAGVGSGSSAGPAAAVAAAAAAANGAVGRRLKGTDLRALVPLGLGLMAARRALRGEERLADAPWYILAWYASETFWKFHVTDGEEK
jgi:hypothetical protein